MNKILNYTILSILSIFIASCATPVFRSLPPEAKKEITETNIVVIENQKTIKAEFIISTESTEAMGGGILWALIDSVKDSPRKEEQQQALKPIQFGLAKYNFSEQLANTLEKELSASKWLNVNKSQVFKDINDIMEAAFPVKNGNALLVCDTEYRLTPSLRTLRIESFVSLYTKDKKLSEFASPEGGEINNAYLLYRKKLMYQYTLIGVENNQQKVAETWMANNGEKLFKELKRGMEKHASQIVFDLEYINTRSN